MRANRSEDVLVSRMGNSPHPDFIWKYVLNQCARVDGINLEDPKTTISIVQLRVVLILDFSAGSGVKTSKQRFSSGDDKILISC